MMHLIREMHDVTLSPTSTWCEADRSLRDCTSNVDHVDCVQCLLLVVEHGEECKARLKALGHSLMLLTPTGPEKP
jgi:hypothetical protein